jgi:hypothetical protein
VQKLFSAVFFPRPFSQHSSLPSSQYKKHVIRACRYIFRDHYGGYYCVYGGGTNIQLRPQKKEYLEGGLIARQQELRPLFG